MPGGYAVLPFPTLTALLSEPDWRSVVSADHPVRPAEEVTLSFPVSTGKIICVGLNYRTHVLETGRQLPEYPTLFAKFPQALLAPHADLQLPEASSQVDWEAELGVVIGAPARNVGQADALESVAGYTVVNDITVRDWQRRSNQWMQGKNFEASTPVGPVVVTPEEIDHARDLRITCSVDGEVMQDGRTSDLVFDVAELISYISRFITLLPGDLIATGTPGGVGQRQSPPRFLRAGETLRTSIEGIGELTNRVVA